MATRTRKKSIRDMFLFFDPPPSDPDNYRLVLKNGTTTIKLRGSPSARQFCYPNFFLSLVDLGTKWIIILLLSAFLFSWCLFGFGFYIISLIHGDFKNSGGTLQGSSNNSFCIYNGFDFVSILLFSMETQTTIGYGSRYVTEECEMTIVLVVCQSIFGCLLQSILTGIFLFKFQQPKKRAHTVLFSKAACVYEEDENYYIEIQIMNMQRSQLIDPKVHGICVMNREDGSGKFRFDMDFNPCNRNSRLLFRPKIYRHLVDNTSPFWDFSRTDFESGQYEIILMIEGVDEFTDSFVQARTSYLPKEIEWGTHFKAMTATRNGNMYRLNFSDFTKTRRQCNMPEMSASTKKLSDITVPDSIDDEEVEPEAIQSADTSYTTVDMNTLY